ncbi:hypothetical protein PR202_gb14558 [Eleusine coracana subsp. coracana]|uniref:Nucleotide-diphospho-sugar transferase domain-containing protein n=1 Tax=Eleusine coracana subsp. coracana TaxID=191504 RepID=A0AAV5EVR3_ELECO|nr:hypothetical protein PR202_gb14558 [Eleusine coracana subsp. coracana]
MSAPSTARSRGLPSLALRRAAAALLLATLVALPFAVLYRAAVSRSQKESWGWDSLPSVAASEEEEEGPEADGLVSTALPPSINAFHLAISLCVCRSRTVVQDADIMWFRNPFPHFYPDGDFQIACDHYVGNSSDLRNIANGGFIYTLD